MALDILPTATARAHLASFRECRREMAASRGNDHYCRWRSRCHQVQFWVKELRREFPRARSRKVQEVQA